MGNLQNVRYLRARQLGHTFQQNRVGVLPVHILHFNLNALPVSGRLHSEFRFAEMTGSTGTLVLG